MSTINYTKAKTIVAWALATAITGLFLFSASGKILHPEMMDAMKLSSFKTIIPIGEIVSALLFFFPKTNVYGGVLLSSYMGGAIILHMTGGMSIFMPAAVLILVWVVSILRNPDIIKLK